MSEEKAQDIPIDLHFTMDARIWTDAFCKIVGEKIPQIRTEQDWMLGWFANAIMAGYDAAKREYEPDPRDDFGKEE